MLRKLLYLFVALPVGLVLIAFAVANRAPATVVLDPFAASAATAALAWTVPLYLLVFGALVAGVILGGVASWISTGRWRGTARRARAEVEHLRAELARANRPAADAPPALPRYRQTNG